MMEPSEFIKKYLTDDLSKEVVDAELQNAAAEQKMDYVVQDGKIYYELEGLGKSFESSAKLAKMLSAVKGDVAGLAVAEGMLVAADTMNLLNSEALRREANKIAGV